MSKISNSLEPSMFKEGHLTGLKTGNKGFQKLREDKDPLESPRGRDVKVEVQRGCDRGDTPAQQRGTELWQIFKEGSSEEQAASKN